MPRCQDRHYHTSPDHLLCKEIAMYIQLIIKLDDNAWLEKTLVCLHEHGKLELPVAYRMHSCGRCPVMTV